MQKIYFSDVDHSISSEDRTLLDTFLTEIALHGWSVTKIVQRSSETSSIKKGLPASMPSLTQTKPATNSAATLPCVGTPIQCALHELEISALRGNCTSNSIVCKALKIAQSGNAGSSVSTTLQQFNSKSVVSTKNGLNQVKGEKTTTTRCLGKPILCKAMAVLKKELQAEDDIIQKYKLTGTLPKKLNEATALKLITPSLAQTTAWSKFINFIFPPPKKSSSFAAIVFQAITISKTNEIKFRLFTPQIIDAVLKKALPNIFPDSYYGEKKKTGRGFLAQVQLNLAKFDPNYVARNLLGPILKLKYYKYFCGFIFLFNLLLGVNLIILFIAN